MKQGEDWPRRHDLSSLRVLGSVGEPINPEAWLWYRENIGGGSAPVVDTWWQTETGQIMITPLPGRDDDQARQRDVPVPRASRRTWSTPTANRCRSVVAATSSSSGRGRRCCAASTATRSATSQTYWSRFPGMYFAGDGAKRDEDGYFWLLGRVDDVMNVAGHRISTTEVESALVDHRSVAEAAVVGKKDHITGQAIFAFVILRLDHEPSDALGIQLREHVANVISPIAKPKSLMFTPDLPKTRSGKIMRRLLRDIAEGRALGDTTTLADETVVETIRENSGAAEE